VRSALVWATASATVVISQTSMHFCFYLGWRHLPDLLQKSIYGSDHQSSPHSFEGVFRKVQAWSALTSVCFGDVNSGEQAAICTHSLSLKG
jgi:hypothetical protein